MRPPNLVERIENLLAALDGAQGALLEVDEPDDGRWHAMDEVRSALLEISHAQGIAGELLTMIDGR